MFRNRKMPGVMLINIGDTLSYGLSVKTDIVVTYASLKPDDPEMGVFNNPDVRGAFYGLVCGKASTDIQKFYLDQVTKNYTTGEVA